MAQVIKRFRQLERSVGALTHMFCTWAEIWRRSDRKNVSDPYSLNPDPAKNLNPDPDPGNFVSTTKKFSTLFYISCDISYSKLTIPNLIRYIVK